MPTVLLPRAVKPVRRLGRLTRPVAPRPRRDRADAVGRDTEQLMRLLYEVVLSEDQGDFWFGQAELPDAAKGEIDRLANQLKADAPGNVYIEIEGHTDATGEANVNERLGLACAEAVKRYLHESTRSLCTV